MNPRCVACGRFTKSVNKRKKEVESVNEANAEKSIVLNDVLWWNWRIIACKNRKLDDGSRFSDNRGTFSENDDFSESSDKDSEFETRIKSKVNERVEHIRIRIQWTVATYKYRYICYEDKIKKRIRKLDEKLDETVFDDRIREALFEAQQKLLKHYKNVTGSTVP